MNSLPRVQSVAMVACAATVLVAGFAVCSGAQVPDRPALGGVWTLNTELSDPSLGQPESGNGGGAGERGGRGDRGDRGAGRGGGRRGGGGLGGVGRGGGMGRPGGRGNPEEAARVRDAIRDIIEPPAHLTITHTETMVVLTGPDGRTTRLSPDGRTVKDENTRMERKTRWDGGKLVSEISGLGQRKMTQTFSVDPEYRQLRITVLMEGDGRSGSPRTISRVYDADSR